VHVPLAVNIYHTIITFPNLSNLSIYVLQDYSLLSSLAPGVKSSSPFIRHKLRGLANWLVILRLINPSCQRCHIDTGSVPEWYKPLAHNSAIESHAMARNGVDNGELPKAVHTLPPSGMVGN